MCRTDPRKKLQKFGSRSACRARFSFIFMQSGISLVKSLRSQETIKPCNAVRRRRRRRRKESDIHEIIRAMHNTEPRDTDYIFGGPNIVRRVSFDLGVNSLVFLELLGLLMLQNLKILARSNFSILLPQQEAWEDRKH